MIQPIYSSANRPDERESVPNLWQPLTDVVALCCSDLHLWHIPPVARSAEPDWFASMKRPLRQLEHLRRKLRCPVIYAGDTFDRHNPPPELVNFALQHLPPGYAIPGQHDLPHHNYDDIKKSAFWTLVKAGKLTLIRPDEPIEDGIGTPIRLHGFPFGFPLKPLKNPNDLLLEIAVIHQYVWKEGFGYQGAPDSGRYDFVLPLMTGYDIIIAGDNHKPFRFGKLYNNGCFIRRKADEVDYKPCIGLIHKDGKIKRHYLDCSEDVFLQAKDLSRLIETGLEEFLEELASLQDSAINFADAVKQYLEKKKVAKNVRRIILKALEDK